MTRIDPHDARDLAYSEAQKALSRVPHREMVMLSANSVGALKTWYCPVCATRGLEGFAFSVTAVAPVCRGG